MIWPYIAPTAKLTLLINADTIIPSPIEFVVVLSCVYSRYFSGGILDRMAVYK